MIKTSKELIDAYKDYYEYLQTKAYAPDDDARSSIYDNLEKMKNLTAAENALLNELKSSVATKSSNQVEMTRANTILSKYRDCLENKTFILKDPPWDNYIHIQKISRDNDDICISGHIIGTNSAYTVPDICPWGTTIKGGISGLSVRIVEDKLAKVPFFDELTEISPDGIIAKMEAMTEEYKKLNDACISKFKDIVRGTSV